MEKDQLELMRRRLTEQFRNTVEKEIIRRYSWFGFIAIVLTCVAIYFLVSNMLSDARVNLESAITVQKLTSERLSVATEQAEELARKAMSAERRLETGKTDIDRKLSELKGVTEAFKQDVRDITDRDFTLTAELVSELKNIGEVVQELAAKLKTQETSEPQETETADTQSALTQPENLAARLDEFQQSLVRFDTLIADALKRVNFWPYPVRIMQDQQATTLLDKLRAAGFSAYVLFNSFVPEAAGTESSSADEFVETIGISSQMPVDKAILLIRLVREELPALRYVYQDRLDMIDRGAIIGKMRGDMVKLSLNPLSEADFQSLFREGQSQDEFYSQIPLFVTPFL
jgi:hypothetical protein